MVPAALIRPVADLGPDSVRNGIALSGTVHWMFDRGLLSVDDDYSILIAEDRLPAPVPGLVNPDRRLCPPSTEWAGKGWAVGELRLQTSPAIVNVWSWGHSPRQAEVADSVIGSRGC